MRQEHLAASIDKATLAGPAAVERLAVLALLLQQEVGAGWGGLGGAEEEEEEEA
jgi:hypothetical protein